MLTTASTKPWAQCTSYLAGEEQTFAQFFQRVAGGSPAKDESDSDRSLWGSRPRAL
jgi:hypothetical protein